MLRIISAYWATVVGAVVGELVGKPVEDLGTFHSNGVCIFARRPTVGVTAGDEVGTSWK